MKEAKKSPNTASALPDVRPLADRVIVRPLEKSEEMKGGLYIPDTAKEKPQQGEVVAVGPGGMEKGERIPMELKVGQKVLYGKYSGTEVTIDDTKLLIVKESDVLAVIGQSRT
jgi:chaperonin GroES